MSKGSSPLPHGRGSGDANFKGPTSQYQGANGLMLTPASSTSGYSAAAPSSRTPATRKVPPDLETGSAASSGQQLSPKSNLSSPTSLEMQASEAKLRAENAQATARLHAEHAQRISQLLLGSIDSRPADLEDDQFRLAKPGKKQHPSKDPKGFGCCQACSGEEGGKDTYTARSRAQEVKRLMSLHGQSLQRQEAQHARQMALLQQVERASTQTKKESLLQELR